MNESLTAEGPRRGRITGIWRLSDITITGILDGVVCRCDLYERGSTVQVEDKVQVPEWFGAAARGISFFPLLMSVYMIIYSVWWPFAWGLPGLIVFVLVVVLAAIFSSRGIRQIRHSRQFEAVESPEDTRIARAMGIVNSVTHPIWMVGTVALLIFGQGRWVMPLMVFVIGAHFLPMARILGRWIDYPLGLLMMAFAVIGGALATDPSVPWIIVFAVAGTGGTIATGVYAAYMAREYARRTRAAGLSFP